MAEHNAPIVLAHTPRDCIVHVECLRPSGETDDPPKSSPHDLMAEHNGPIVLAHTRGEKHLVRSIAKIHPIATLEESGCLVAKCNHVSRRHSHQLVVKSEADVIPTSWLCSQN